MKSLKYSLIGLALVAAGLTSCQDEYSEPRFVTPVAKMTPNTTIADFKQMLVSTLNAQGVEAVVVPQRPDGSDYIIHGRVISSDASGNIYQSLAIQDETSAINLTIREASMWTTYRVGQDVVLNVTGLYMGTYADLYQVGWVSDYNGAPSMTFMSWFMFRQHSALNGVPNQNIEEVTVNGPWPSENPYMIVTTIGEINSLSATGNGLNVMSQLVEVRNVQFQEGGVETFAPYQENNVRRTIQDASNPNQTLILNNSGYSTFYNEMLPTGTGSVRGILSYYNGAWQLILRGIDDVLFDFLGTVDQPYTVAQALMPDYFGYTGWVQGYIVGSVKAGVAQVTSDSDVIFGAEGETFDNVLIADNPNERDWTKCIIVNLPNNSKLRDVVNLVDNSELLGELLSVYGNIGTYYGMTGITGNTGASSTFRLDGIEIE
ncbi:MAG: hypothetical protein J1E97_08440 [Muribaculaceae bacterium]|nr:hypothetical protein [Muribaculaceae bacterium]